MMVVLQVVIRDGYSAQWGSWSLGVVPSFWVLSGFRHGWNCGSWKM